MGIFKEIRAFLWAVLSTWQAYMTGGIVIALLGIYERVARKAISLKSFIIGVIVFLLAAFFLAWRDQYRRANTTEQTLASKTIPNLVLHIDSLGTGGTGGTDAANTNMFVVASIINRGAPSIADAWTMKIALPGRAPFVVLPNMLKPEEKLYFKWDDGRSVTMSQADSLYAKAIAQPVQSGAKIRGIMTFTIIGTARTLFDQTGIVYTLRCKDVTEKDVETDFAPTEKPGTDFNYYFPGLTPPDVSRKTE